MWFASATVNSSIFAIDNLKVLYYNEQKEKI